MKYYKRNDTTDEKLWNDTKFDNFFIFQDDVQQELSKYALNIGQHPQQPKLPSPKQIPMLPNNDNKVRVET